MCVLVVMYVICIYVFMYVCLYVSFSSLSFLRECVCIHLDSDMDKFNILVYMTRKLFAFAKGECANESADNPANQEVLLGGHLYLMTLKVSVAAIYLGNR